MQALTDAEECRCITNWQLNLNHETNIEVRCANNMSGESSESNINGETGSKITAHHPLGTKAQYAQVAIH